jgi:hypothetical protein
VNLQGTDTAFSEGIAEMERGDWSRAAKQFGLALHAAEFKERTAEASAYLTAVRLVEAQVRFPYEGWGYRPVHELTLKPLGVATKAIMRGFNVFLS